MTMLEASGKHRRRHSGRLVRRIAAVAAKALAYSALFLLLGLPATAHAAPPDLQTPAPVIYLADNLDEQDRLGWCIDTRGRGFSDRLHTHSCKPRGGDVQFRYDEAARRIASAAFQGKCAELLAPAAAGVTLGLLDCAKDAKGQAFDYDAAAMEFRPGADGTLCLVAGAASRSAGPFMSRDLALAPCTSTDAKFKQWRIRKARP
ncbi:MAG: ricin-type beta-trefoil lectin domain protein [Nitrospinae bacterium]|nr:ricin-type beta-trefoil lectin domain protein [Nitrospinota bacterium]